MQDKITETYLNLLNEEISNKNDIILEEYHRNFNPLGWTSDYFVKVIVQMLKSTIKEFGEKNFDEYFIAKKLFSFNDLFQTEPNVSIAGSGKNLTVILNYEIETEKESDKILFGNFNKTSKELQKSQKKKGLLNKLFGKLDTNDRGILWNFSFLDEFKEAGLINKNVESSGKDEDKKDRNKETKQDEKNEEEEGIDGAPEKDSVEESVITKTYLKSIILEEENSVPPFEIDEKYKKLKLDSIGVSFEFNKINYCEKTKEKDFYNPNRVINIEGIAYLKFVINKRPLIIKVTSDTGVNWIQYRTKNMDPPTPIKDEIKKIWDNPNQGFGLLGLGIKKLVGAGGSLLFGNALSQTVSEVKENTLRCNFLSEFKISNTKGVAVKERESSEKKGPSLEDIIENLINQNGKIDFTVENNNKEYTCKGLYNGLEIITISFKIQ